jgi:K+-sensing histidine kinase KdpD
MSTSQGKIHAAEGCRAVVEELTTRGPPAFGLAGGAASAWLPAYRMARWFAIAPPTQATLLQITLAMRSLRIANDVAARRSGLRSTPDLWAGRVMIRDRRDLVLGWLLATVGVVVAIVITAGWPPLFWSRYLLLTMAIVVAGWYGGLWLGVLASVLAAVAGEFALFRPLGAVLNFDTIARFLTFLITASSRHISVSPSSGTLAPKRRRPVASKTSSSTPYLTNCASR